MSEQNPTGTPKGISGKHAQYRRYEEWLHKTLCATEKSDFIRRFQPLILSNRATRNASPFLSVILRTQGKRDTMLTEALNCLATQTDSDFEVLLICHKATAEDTARTGQLVSSLPVELRERVRMETLDSGTRAAPLNYGACLAQGRYFAMLDDDDLVDSDWVENFHTALEAHDGEVLRCYGRIQRWTVVTLPNGTEKRRAIGPEEPRYCKPFSLTEQLNDNFTPISCVAIPTDCFQSCGLCFNETLNTAEDWDYIMRCILLCGVFDTGHCTFLYRLWSNAESSRTLHSRQEWKSNRRKIIRGLDRIPILTNRAELLSGRTVAIRQETVREETVRRETVRQEVVLPGYRLSGALRQTARIFRCLFKNRLSLRKNLKILHNSPLFDAVWYQNAYPDVAASNFSPEKHYLLYGWWEMRNPSAKFSTLLYLSLNPDVASTGDCPLIHYEQNGRQEGRLTGTENEENRKNG